MTDAKIRHRPVTVNKTVKTCLSLGLRSCHSWTVRGIRAPGSLQCLGAAIRIYTLQCAVPFSQEPALRQITCAL